jgi:hypothetical protein
VRTNTSSHDGEGQINGEGLGRVGGGGECVSVFGTILDNCVCIWNEILHNEVSKLPEVGRGNRERQREFVRARAITPVHLIRYEGKYSKKGRERIFKRVYQR